MSWLAMENCHMSFKACFCQHSKFPYSCNCLFVFRSVRLISVVVAVVVVVVVVVVNVVVVVVVHSGNML